MPENTQPTEQQELLNALHNDSTIKVVKEAVHIRPDRLKFNEASLTNFIESEGVWYNYFGHYLANAESELQVLELRSEATYASKFADAKGQGNSDKLADAVAKADPDYENSQIAVINAKRNVKLLQQHLRAWDKAHENAQSRGHMLRKEIDKLNADIFSKTDGFVPSSGIGGTLPDDDEINKLVGN